MEYSYMTKEGYQKLLDEINHLESVERPEISRQIAEARDKGDLSENAEYDAAKEAQGHLESRIAILKSKAASARIVDPSQISTDTVKLLTKVRTLNLGTKKEMVFTLVAETEANLKENKISVKTPIAKGLIGKKVGEVAEIQIPAGLLRLEILEISI